MAADKRIDNILRHLSELKDLLLVIDGQGEKTPDVLYRLADEKATCITQSIWKLRDSRFWQRLDEFEDEEELVYDMEEAGKEPVSVREIESSRPDISFTTEPDDFTPDTEETDIVLNKRIQKVMEISPAEITEKEALRKPEETSLEKEVVTEPALLDNTNMTLEEVIQRRRAKDLKKAISLNDRFRFRKELFGNNDILMGETLDALNQMESYIEATNYLSSCCDNWDNESEAVGDFMNIVEKHFL